MLQHNILYSCEDYQKRGHEQLVTEHAFGYIVSGETHFYSNGNTQIFGAGTIGLIKKNLLAKTLKVPASDGTPFKSINIFLDQASLKKYSTAHNINITERYTGDMMIRLNDDAFIKSYFNSLLPYFNNPGQLSDAMAEIKTWEAIELLLRSRPSLKDFLFDFSEPYKIDLEAFMNQNYMYNIPMSNFAKLTGRSLATFKRDFSKVFASPPEKWLLHKRLQEAHYLLKEHHLNPGNVYIEVGFENLSHFSSSFKKQYGYTPSSVGVV